MKYQNKLKECRNHLWLTQQDVVMKTRIPLSSYQRYNQGEHLPNVRVAIRIAKALKEFPEEL